MPKLPTFASEEEEADFWATHSTADYFDEIVPTDEQFILKQPPKTLISLRMQSSTIDQIKQLAAKKGIGYQTMIRMWVMERLAEENKLEDVIPVASGAGNGVG